MRFPSALFLALALGCAPAPSAGPQLHFVDFGSNDPAHPMLFALKIANDAGDVLIDAIEANTSNESVIGDIARGHAPSGFRAAVTLMDPTPRDGRQVPLTGKATTISGGITPSVSAALVWDLPDDPPPLLAIVGATFTLKHKGKVVLTTPAHAFLIESRPGVLDALMRDAGKNPASDVELLRVLTELEGKPSERIRELRVRLIGGCSRRHS